MQSKPYEYDLYTSEELVGGGRNKESWNRQYKSRNIITPKSSTMVEKYIIQQVYKWLHLSKLIIWYQVRIIMSLMNKTKYLHKSITPIISLRAG